MIRVRFEPIVGRRKMEARTLMIEEPALRHVIPVFSEEACVCTPPALTAPRRAWDPRICRVVFEATGEVSEDGAAIYRESVSAAE